MKFVAKPRDNDTVDVFVQRPDDPEALERGRVSRVSTHLWLTFTCDPKVAEAEEACWIAIQRTDGGSRAALAYLVEAWANIGQWADEFKDKPVPDLLCEFKYTKGN